MLPEQRKWLLIALRLSNIRLYRLARAQLCYAEGLGTKEIAKLMGVGIKTIISWRGVAIFAKAFLGIPAQQAAKITRPPMPSAAPAVLLHSLHTQRGVCNIVAQ